MVIWNHHFFQVKILGIIHPLIDSQAFNTNGCLGYQVVRKNLETLGILFLFFSKEKLKRQFDNLVVFEKRWIFWSMKVVNVLGSLILRHIRRKILIGYTDTVIPW